MGSENINNKLNYNFCKYADGKKLYNFGRCYYECNKTCPTVSNIFYGKIIKIPILKQIYNAYDWLKQLYEQKEFEKDYISEYETKLLKFIWGVKSGNCFTLGDASLYSMNDIDITYNKKLKLYCLGIETAYLFQDAVDECKYLKDMLNIFTEYMDRNNYSKNEPYMFFMNNLGASLSAKTIEELYINFKIFVEGYCKVYEIRGGVINNSYSMPKRH